MEWEVSPAALSVERQILTGMVVSDRALREIGLAYKPKFFPSPYARTVARWCLEHQAKYGRAPRADIKAVFEASSLGGGMDETEVRLVAQLLSSISSEFERSDEAFNEALCVDTAMEYFRRRGLELLRDDLSGHLEGGNVAAARAAVAEYEDAAVATDIGCDPLSKDILIDAFSERNDLFVLPGDVGRMVTLIERGNTVAVVGKYKGTKSYTSQWIAMQAWYSHLNVAWFDFEMGKRRFVRRLAQSLCAMPLRAPEGGAVTAPVWDCKLNQTGECNRPERACRTALVDSEGKFPDLEAAPAGYRPCDACPAGRSKDNVSSWLVKRRVSELGWRTAWRKAQAVAASVMGARFRFHSWPKFSAGVDDVENALKVWRHQDGFSPDLIVADQPSGMRMSGRGDFRHQVDELWKRLCAIPQSLHCLAIYPSQAGGKEAQGRKRLRDSDVAEHSGILGHVDGTIKIDSDEDERLKRAYISAGVERDDDSPNGCCMVLQCLATGQPVLDSRFV